MLKLHDYAVRNRSRLWSDPSLIKIMCTGLDTPRSTLALELRNYIDESEPSGGNGGS